MMEHDAVTQTMYIAALGTEYTFKVAGASAKIIMSLIEKIAEKARLTTADKKLLRLASDDVATAVTMKDKDLKSFKTYAKDFGLTYVVVGNKHQVETGLIDVIVRQDQLARVNEFLNRIGYGKVVEDVAKKDSPLMSESIEPTHEFDTSTGIDSFTTTEASERMEPPDMEKIDQLIALGQVDNTGIASTGIPEKKESYIDTLIENAEDTASHQNVERVEKVAEKVTAVAEKMETVLEVK